MRENADQNNSEYGHFLRGDSFRVCQYFGVKMLPARDIKWYCLQKKIYGNIRDFINDLVAIL